MSRKNNHKGKVPMKKRARKYVAGVLALVLVPMAAYAAYVLLYGFSGSVSTASMAVAYEDPAVTAQTNLTCSVNPATGGKDLRVSITKALPGGTCEIEVKLKEDGAKQDYPLKVQKVTFGSGSAWLTTAFSSASQCGVSPAKYQPTFFQGQSVKFKIKVSEDAPMNATYTADSGKDGLTVVKADDYVAANCLAWNGDGTAPAGV